MRSKRWWIKAEVGFGRARTRDEVKLLLEDRFGVMLKVESLEPILDDESDPQTLTQEQ